MITSEIVLWFMFIIYIGLFCNLLHKHLLKNIFGELFPPPGFYFASPISNQYSDHSYYNVSVFSIENGFTLDLMIHIMPQDLYFFLDDNKLIYHPKEEELYKMCDNEFRKAFIISLDKSDDASSNYIYTQNICHRNLDYLKNLYKYKVFYKTFDKLQNPETIIDLIINSINKGKSIKKILKHAK